METQIIFFTFTPPLLSLSLSQSVLSSPVATSHSIPHETTVCLLWLHISTWLVIKYFTFKYFLSFKLTTPFLGKSEEPNRVGVLHAVQGKSSRGIPCLLVNFFAFTVFLFLIELFSNGFLKPEKQVGELSIFKLLQKKQRTPFLLSISFLFSVIFRKGS